MTKAQHEERRRQQEQLEADFPSATLRRYEDGRGVTIELAPCLPTSITVATRGDLSSISVDLSHGWKEVSIPLSLDTLAPFLHALIKRYNGMVARANAETDIRCEQLTKAPGAQE